MQAITFPFDSSGTARSATTKPRTGSNSASHEKSGDIKVGEYQEIMFTRSGVLSHDNGHAFAKDLPQGYFGIGTVIFAGAAVSTTTPIKITFDDDVNTDRYIFTLSVVP